MTKISRLVLCACMAGGISLASCTSTSGDAVSFESRADSCAYMTPDWYGDTVYSIATYNIMWPTQAGKADLSALRDSVLKCAFDTVAANFDQSAERFFRKGPVDGLDVALQPVSMETARKADKCNELMAEGYVSLLTPDLIVIGIDSYGYFFGAAHGYGTSSFINYSIADQCVLTMANMFETDKIDDVMETVRETAHEMYPNGEVNPDDITALNAFRITPKSVVFVFQPYDVAPYSMGVVEIPVSIYDLYETLTPLGHKVLSF